MTSERRLRANRQNAKRSTGPKSLKGKQTASRNAFRHGLALLHCNEAHSERVRTLALSVCDDADPFRFEQALSWAEAELALQQVRAARVAGLEQHADGCHSLARAISHVARLERYERRALARRKRAVGILSLLRQLGRPTTQGLGGRATE